MREITHAAVLGQALGEAVTPALLVPGLVAAAQAVDLTDDLALVLEKARLRPLIPRLPREVALLQTVRHLVGVYAPTITALIANVSRWLQARYPETDKSLRKALDRPLTAEQIEELRQLIAAHFKVAPGSPARWSIPPDVWARWQAEGLVVPGVPLPAIADAYVAGRLYQVVTAATAFATMKELAAQIPRTRALTLAETWAQQHAGETIRGFGERLAARGVARALSIQQRIIREQVGQFLEDRYTAPGRPVTSWRAFAQDLAREFRSTDAERDWHRVAVSETRLAYNAGRVQALDEDGVEQMYFLVQPDACRHCKAVYLEPDGTPRRFRVRGLLATILETGGTNIGRLASAIGDPDRGWVPNALLHPWCRCVPMPVLRGLRPLRIVR